MRLASFTQKPSNEPSWHILAAIVVAIGFQLLLKKELVYSSKYTVAGLEAALLPTLVLLAALVTVALVAARAVNILG